MADPKEFAIIGGSFAGLFSAIALKILGHNVRVFERTATPTLHDYGAGLVAGNETQEFLARYDLCKTPVAISSPVRYYLNRKGEFISSQEWVQQMTSWDLIYHILRANYDRLKSDYVRKPPVLLPEEGSGTYEYGCTLTEKRIRAAGSRVNLVIKKSTDKTEEVEVDYAIAADGPSSTVRKLLYPNIERKNVGYVLWRGTVPESSLSCKGADTFVEKFVFYHSAGLQAIGYLIPGPGGVLDSGKRVMNWACYCNFAEDSLELKELMTDKNGRQHRYTLPRGQIRPEIWQKHQAEFEQRLPPQFSELAQKTQDPFVQVITDVATPRAVYDDRVLFVGDALCGFRPHTAAGTSQAARNALGLADWLRNSISLEAWEEVALSYARRTQQHGVNIGNRSQFETHPLAD